MADLIHTILLWIHIPFGFLSLVLFWIPVGVKKGSPVHKKVGWYYFICMWVVLFTAFALSLVNIVLERYMSAIYLGYLAIITAYPLWYSFEILKQKKEWTARYFLIRKICLSILSVTAIAMISIAWFKYQFKNMGTMMFFFGLIALPSIREVFMSKEKATNTETRIKMHIQGTIITGIAAYTAFFAFGGSRILMGVLNLSAQWMMVPWIAPTVLGVIYMRYMKKKFLKMA